MVVVRWQLVSRDVAHAQQLITHLLVVMLRCTYPTTQPHRDDVAHKSVSEVWSTNFGHSFMESPQAHECLGATRGHASYIMKSKRSISLNAPRKGVFVKKIIMSIALTTHKVAAAAVGVAMVFSFAFVTPAQAQTVEELTAQINSLLSTIASLQAQLSGMTGGTTGGTTTGGTCYNFTQNHSMGDSGGQVMWIQKYMNANGFTVSASGAGSPGQESSYFGAKTKAAVIAWQNANAAGVLAPVGLTAGTGFWGSSSRGFANANCNPGTGTGTGTGTTVPTGTGVTVAAAAQPANGLAPASATRVPFTKFTITNNSGTTQTINNVTVKRTGLAQNAAFDGVILLDQNGTQLGNARVINSDDTVTVGTAVTLQPGQSQTFTVAANMKSTLTSYAGEVATFSVIAINTSATVAGSLPIVGAAHTINATLAIGTLTTQRGVEDPGADDTKEIGTTNYKFTALKFTAGSAENVRLWSVRFDQSGSASSSDLANVMAWVDGQSYPVTVDGDYYTVSFPGGILINEGLSKELIISGDIVGGTNRTIAFDVRKHTDVYATGETYGYGVKADDGNTTTSGAEGTYDDESTPAYNAYDVTVSAGTFNSVSKSNAAPAANIAQQKSDEILGAFTVDIKGEGIQVQTLNFDIDPDAGLAARKITNVTLVDQNGVVLAGPVDSTTLSTGALVADALTFSNVTFPTGVTTVFVKGQLNSSWANNDTLAVSTAPNSDWSDATGLSTGDTVTLPSGTATANTMTIKSAALAITTLTQPAARSVVAGAQDVIYATASLDAADSGEDIKVTSLSVLDTTSGGAIAANLDNVEIWANLTGGSTADSVRGDRFETRIADAEQMTDTDAGDDETLVVSLDTNVDVTKNNSVEVAVVIDLSSSAVDTETHTISISSANAVGKTSGSSVTPTTSGSGQAMTNTTGGALTITVDASSPNAALIRDDVANEQTVAVFRFAASNVEDIDIDSINITDDGSDDTVAMYKFYVGSTLVGTKVGGATAQVFFNDGTVVAPKNGHILVTVKAVMNDIDGAGVTNGSTVQATIAAAGDVEATGRDSGSSLTPTLTSGDAATHTVYESVPSVAFDNSGVSTVLVNNTNHLLAKIVITNTGDEDITMDSTATNELRIQISVVGDGTATPSLTLKDEDGNVLDSNSTYDTDAGAQEIIFNFDGAFTGDVTVPAGGSETLSIFADTSDLPDDGDTIQVWLDDVADDFAFGIDGTGDFTEGDNVFKGDIFGPVHVNPS